MPFVNVQLAKEMRMRPPPKQSAKNKDNLAKRTSPQVERVARHATADAIRVFDRSGDADADAVQTAGGAPPTKGASEGGARGVHAVPAGRCVQCQRRW